MTGPICLALAIYFEARGEPLEGQVAVAQVIINWVESPDFPNTICGVVKQPHQFSFYSDSIPNEPRNAQAWNLAQSIAEVVIEGRAPDMAYGALWYYAPSKVSPGWAKDLDVVANIGNHKFMGWSDER
jgi:N-acetylmuramoyl-L-alanine amidase